MLQSFFRTICRVGIFMICAQALMHFRAGDAYEKYLKLLVSIMILIQLFLPVGNFFLGKGTLDTAGILEQFRRGLEQGMREAEKNAAAADKLLEQMTLEEIRKLTEKGNPWPEESGSGGTAPEADPREEGTAAEADAAEPETTGSGDPLQDAAGERGNQAPSGEIEIRVEDIGPITIK